MNRWVSTKVRSQVLLHGFAYSFPMSGIFSALKYLKIVRHEMVFSNHRNIVDRGTKMCTDLMLAGLISGYRHFGVCFNLLLNKPIAELWEKEAMFYKHGLHMGVWNNYKDGILIMMPLDAGDSYFDNLIPKLVNCFKELNQQN
jgi:adenosylmethionine-8-amino-7-oxononanoate aminotransferase